MWFMYFHISLIPSILFTAIYRGMPQSKAAVTEKWLTLYVHLLTCLTLLQIVIKLSVINFGLSGNFVLFFVWGGGERFEFRAGDRY